MEKTIGVETKISLQPPSKTREIDSKYSKNSRPLVKKDKNNTNWEHWSRDKDKTKSHNPSFANTS